MSVNSIESTYFQELMRIYQESPQRSQKRTYKKMRTYCNQKIPDFETRNQCLLSAISQRSLAAIHALHDSFRLKQQPIPESTAEYAYKTLEMTQRKDVESDCGSEWISGSKAAKECVKRSLLTLSQEMSEFEQVKWLKSKHSEYSFSYWKKIWEEMKGVLPDSVYAKFYGQFRGVESNFSIWEIGCFLCHWIGKLNRLEGAISWAETNPFIYGQDEACKGSALKEFISQTKERKFLCEKLISRCREYEKKWEASEPHIGVEQPWIPRCDFFEQIDLPMDLDKALKVPSYDTIYEQTVQRAKVKKTEVCEEKEDLVL